MSCRHVREALMEASGELAPGLRDHLATCPACTRFAARLGQARDELRRPQVHLEPDASFAARVLQRLPDPTEMLGWAALRLLPAALALVLVLSWWSWQTPAELVDQLWLSSLWPELGL